MPKQARYSTVYYSRIGICITLRSGILSMYCAPISIQIAIEYIIHNVYLMYEILNLNMLYRSEIPLLNYLDKIQRSNPFLLFRHLGNSNTPYFILFKKTNIYNQDVHVYMYIIFWCFPYSL